MTSDHPVHVEVSSPVRFERVQLVVRIALAIALGWIGITVGWLACVLYLALPLITAIIVSSTTRERFETDLGPRMWRALSWLLQLSAFMMLLVDRFPTGENRPARIEIRFTGTPTTGSALMRLVTSIPSGFVLMLLWFVSSVLWVIGAVIVLVGARMPDWILGFQRGVLRWQARLVAYHASLVEQYPPFSLDTGDERDHVLAATGGVTRW